MKMKRYLIFAGQIYYPVGGVYDFQRSKDTIEEAKEYVEKEVKGTSHEWAHIVDSSTLEIVVDYGISNLV